MGLRHSFTCPYQGQAFLCVKKWFEAQISGILPDVFSYISHFVCLYNFNYTGRPLRVPGIIGIKINKCDHYCVVFKAYHKINEERKRYLTELDEVSIVL